jgi:hypothetical protein
VELAPSSSLSLSFSEGRISGVLSSGQVSVANVDGVAVKIETPNDSITNEGNAPSRFSVSVAGGQTGVAVASGAVRNNNGALTKQDDDDDDDDDHWKAWAWAGGIAAAVVVIILVTRDDDDEIVSPVR